LHLEQAISSEFHDNFIRLGLIRPGGLKPFKQSVGFQEKHALATLHRNQMRLPCRLFDDKAIKNSYSLFDTKRFINYYKLKPKLIMKNSSGFSISKNKAKTDLNIK